MIKNWYVTGDIHGDPNRFYVFSDEKNPEENAIIILGDTGVNYYLSGRDKKLKKKLTNTGMFFYLVRGNHEARPEDIETIVEEYDENVAGNVYIEPAYPQIRYFKDGGTYTIDSHSVLVIGGAYSVDKQYRLKNGWTWFEREQLTTEELEAIKNETAGKHFDIVLSHTCPKKWEPVDLFLEFIDQADVDKTMEEKMDEIEEGMDWKVWLFGHFHRDRLERPGVEMYFKYIDKLEHIWDRWNTDTEPEWWIVRGPRYEGV